MPITISGKGDFKRLSKFNHGDFSCYELYLNTFNEEIITKEIASLPSYIKIESIHTPSCIEIDGKKTFFDISSLGKIGEESLAVLKKTIALGEKLNSKVIVIHGATYNPFNQTKEEALRLLTSRVKPLLKEDLSLSFETDVLWHNLYFSRRALLTEERDFKLLNDSLEDKLNITVDFEHLYLTFYFMKFIEHVGGEKNFLKIYSAFNSNGFQRDISKFINDFFFDLSNKFNDCLSSFFCSLGSKINHIHLNGSDCYNFFLNPNTGLPLVGEHLPLGLKEGEISDKLDYSHIAKLLLAISKEKNINVVLEVWREDPEEYIKSARESKHFLMKYLNYGWGRVKMTDRIVNKTIILGNKEIKNWGKPFVIAEIGSNHNGDIELGKKMIDAAIKCGADCVKFQAFDSHIFSQVCYEDDERKKETIEAHPALRKHLTVTHKDSLKKEILQHVASKEMLFEFKKYCDQKGIIFFCTPLNKQVADFLVDDLDMKFIKVASMDLNNLPFLGYLAKKGKPIVLSTGMGTLAEIVEAVDTITKTGNNQIVLLHCVSLYPPQDEMVHLNNLDLLRNTFDFPVGFSDHTFGAAVSLAAIAKGACMIEKHFTLDKNLPGWDHKISANPEEMKIIVDDGKKIWKALGSYQRVVTPEELDKKVLFGRSIVVVRNMKEGEVITEEDIDYRRPGTGIEPKYGKFVIGRMLKKDLKADDLIKTEHLR